jgi:hypothetical protein
MRLTGIVAAVAVSTMVAFTGLPGAGDFWASKAYADGARAGKYKHKKYRAYRGTRVRAFVQRGGYYSYTDDDSVNTYTGPRGVLDGDKTFRDPLYRRQTPAGPFDDGFFFDSGLGPRFNDSPYAR